MLLSEHLERGRREFLTRFEASDLIFADDFLENWIFCSKCYSRSVSTIFAGLGAFSNEALEIRTNGKVCSLKVSHADFQNICELVDFFPWKRCATVLDVRNELNRALASFSNV